ncbi:MAG: hypothetical protein AB1422_05280 [bacterium]
MIEFIEKLLRWISLPKVKIQQNQVVFKGRNILFVKKWCLDFLFCGIFLSLLFMGRYCWFHSFLCLLVLTSPSFILFCILFAFLFAGFSFDDQKREIVRSKGMSIPYEKVKGIYITEVGKLLRVSIKEKGLLKESSLAEALSIEDKQRLMEELDKRFPPEILHERRFFIWRFPAQTMMLLILFISSIYIFYVYQECPQVRIIPKKRGWEISQPTKENRYNLRGIAFSLPEGFKFVKAKNGRLFFKNKETGIVVDSGFYKSLPSALSLELYYFTGIKESYGLYQAVYYARFGIIPLVLKAIRLSGRKKVEIYEIEEEVFKGFIMRCLQDKRWVADILLKNKKKGWEINFMISSSKRIEEDDLKTIVAVANVTSSLPVLSLNSTRPK